MGAAASGGGTPGLDWNRLGRVVTPAGFSQPNPGSLAYFHMNPGSPVPTSANPVLQNLLSLFMGTGRTATLPQKKKRQ